MSLIKGNISSLIRYSYFSILSDDTTHIFVASLLILYCRFSSLILLSIVLINFYVPSKKFSLECDGLCDAKKESKAICFCSTFFI